MFHVWVCDTTFTGVCLATYNACGVHVLVLLVHDNVSVTAHLEQLKLDTAVSAHMHKG